MSTKPAEAAAAPPKSKKMLVIVAVLLVVIALGAVGAVIYVNKQRAAAQFGDEAPAARQHVETGPPTYLPLDNMVVNLADQGGERVAQIGVTFELKDAQAVDKVRLYMPTIRSSVLLLVSQRTSEELLKIEGKEKLAKDILREASEPFGGIEEVEDADTSKNGNNRSSNQRRRAPVDQTIRRVLFSSFIVQ